MNPYVMRMTTRRINITIICEWDAEAKVWYANSDDLPGLITEAVDIPSLIQRVMEIAPELIEDNIFGKNEKEDYLLNITPLYQQLVRSAAC